MTRARATSGGILRVLALAAPCVVTGGAVDAQVANCAAPQTQIEITMCAEQRWQAADAELNHLWSIVKPGADARGTGQAHLDAQRAWIAYRDATCEAEQAEFQGGSIAPAIYWDCMDRLTRQRNVDLGQLLQR